MAWFRPLGVWLVLLGLLALASCGQSTSPVPDNSGLQGPQNNGAIPSIWELDGLNRGTSVAGGGDVQTVLGANHLENLVYNGTPDGDDLVLDSGASGDPQVAWAVYRFSGLTGKKPEFMSTFATVGGLENKYYVGLANYSEGTWEWYGPSQLPEFEIDLSEKYHRYVTGLGNMYFLVICEGGHVVTHHRTVLVSSLGDGDILPGAPRELQATDGTFADKVVVSWHAGEGADSYEVYRRKDGSNEDFTKIGTTEGTEFVDETADPNTYYIYKARSHNEAGFSAFSNSDAGYRGDIPHEGDCPSELVATDGTYEEKVRLEWHGSMDASYKVWRKPDGGGEFTNIGMSQGNSFNDTEAEPGKHYIYKVSIVSEGETCWSNTDAGWRGEGGDDACPHEVWASDGTHEDKVRLEWMGVVGEMYNIYRWHGEGEMVLIGSTNNELAFNDTEADASVIYNYKVVLVREEEWVCHGTDTGYRSGDPSQEDCPTDLGATDGTYAEKVRLEWNGDPTRGYDIFRKGPNEEEFSFLAYVTGVSYNDESAEPGVTYHYKVGLEMEGGFCWSNIDSGYRGDAGDDYCPSELGASDGTHEAGVSVEWQGTAGQPYKVYRRLDGTDDWMLLDTVEALEFFDETAEVGNFYIYKVAHAVSGCHSNQDSGHRGGGDQ